MLHVWNMNMKRCMSHGCYMYGTTPHVWSMHEPCHMYEIRAAITCNMHARHVEIREKIRDKFTGWWANTPSMDSDEKLLSFQSLAAAEIPFLRTQSTASADTPTHTH